MASVDVDSADLASVGVGSDGFASDDSASVGADSIGFDSIIGFDCVSGVDAAVDMEASPSRDVAKEVEGEAVGPGKLDEANVKAVFAAGATAVLALDDGTVVLDAMFEVGNLDDKVKAAVAPVEAGAAGEPNVKAAEDLVAGGAAPPPNAKRPAPEGLDRGVAAGNADEPGELNENGLGGTGVCSAPTALVLLEDGVVAERLAVGAEE